MWNLCRLEFRKQFPFFAGSILVLLLGFSFSSVVAGYSSRWGAGEVVSGALLLVLFSLPLFLALFAAMPAAALRREAVKTVEEVLPAHPFERVMAAYLVSLIRAAEFFILVLCGLDLMMPYLAYAQPLLQPASWKEDICLLIPSLLFLHMLAFTLTYWLKSSVLAVGLSGVSMYTGYVVSDYLGAIVFNDRQSLQFKREMAVVHNATMATPGVLACIVILGTAVCLYFACWYLLGERVERGKRQGAALVFLIICLLLSGPLSVPAIRMDQAIRTIIYRWPTDITPIACNDRSIGSNSGFYITSRTGSIVRITADGRRSEIVRSRLSALSVLADVFWDNRARHSSHYVEEKQIYEAKDGSLWMTEQDEPTSPLRVLKGSAGQPLRPFCMLPSCVSLPLRQAGVIEASGSVYLRAYEGGSLLFARIGPAPQWTHSTPEPLKEDSATWDFRSHRLFEEMGGRYKSWIVPGIPNLGGQPTTAAFGRGESASFVVSTSYGNYHSLVLCLPDGSVHTLVSALSQYCPFQRISYGYGGGRVWYTYRPGRFYVIDKAKSMPAVIDLDAAEGKLKEFRIEWGSPGVLRLDDARLTIMARGQMWGLLLLTFDLKTGRLVHYYAFPKDVHSQTRTTSEGVYYVSDSRIFLVDWQSKISDLGPIKD